MDETLRHFDVLILGAGSSGSVLASRLSEDPDRTVGIVEAGDWPKDPDIAVPQKWPLLQGKPYDWQFETVPQPFTAGRRHLWPRGRLVGGSSCLHAMAHVRGHPRDFDAWAQAGGEEWSFRALLPYFKRSERFSGGASEFHGDDGPMDVLLPSEGLNPVVECFMAASEAIGIKPSGDHNGRRMKGAAPNSLTIRDGRRLSVADAYLVPVTTRTNLTMLTNRVVNRLSMSGSRVTDVRVRNGSNEEVFTGDTIFLCAGSIASPLILMRSGIGDVEELSRHGVQPQIALPAVGRNLHDHLLGAGNVYRARQPVPLSNYQLSESLLYQGGEEGKPPQHVVACVVAPTVTECFSAPEIGEAFTLMFGFCKPRSRGRILLGGTNPYARPIIDPAYLSEEEDRRLFREALALARQVAGARPMDKWRGDEILPDSQLIANDAAVDSFIARAAMTHHHPVGTCRMGATDQAVVDGKLVVHGLDNLRIVDGSVIPEITSGPVNAAIVAMAEKVAVDQCGP